MARVAGPRSLTLKTTEQLRALLTYELAEFARRKSSDRRERARMRARRLSAELARRGA